MADVKHTGHDCKMCGPSWWGAQRGCYIAAQARYADPKVRVVRGHVYREVITGSFPHSDGNKPFIEQEEI